LEARVSITTVVFDFGNVLGLFSHRRAAEQLAAYGRDHPAEVEAFLFGGQLEDDYEAGRIATPEFIRLVREQFELGCTDEQFCAAFADMFTPNPEVCALVPRLKARYRLLLLTNTNDLHYRQFRPQFAETLGHFDAIVASHEVGCRKPDPRVFRHCERLAGAAQRQCLFIDDLPANVSAARACGWHGILYRPGDDLGEQLLRFGVVLAA
jgi:putative hydrolase of the HAD superfamily